MVNAGRGRADGSRATPAFTTKSSRPPSLKPTRAMHSPPDRKAASSRCEQASLRWRLQAVALWTNCFDHNDVDRRAHVGVYDERYWYCLPAGAQPVGSRDRRHLSAARFVRYSSARAIWLRCLLQSQSLRVSLRRLLSRLSLLSVPSPLRMLFVPPASHLRAPLRRARICRAALRLRRLSPSLRLSLRLWWSLRLHSVRRLSPERLWLWLCRHRASLARAVFCRIRIKRRRIWGTAAAAGARL